MEAKILSNQIENAQKKVEEQNFVARKNVLKYDDVMNTQRVVIYEQRRRVLEGDDLSDEIREWIREVVAVNVRAFTEAEYPEEWDLEGLVNQMNGLYAPSPEDAYTIEELHENVDVTSREELIDEFTEDALDTYSEREERFGVNPDTGIPLMREIERFVVLQVVDTRWREHLESMDYLREGIHLRAMAQKDPLVEYRGEGHAMFEELGRMIREEVVLTLFHVEIAVEEPVELQPSQAPANLQYEHDTSAGADAIAAAGVAEPPQRQIVNEHKDLGRNDPCWCGSGKKFKRCHGA
jgi:preprotein translocase subunit SecA